MNNETRIRIEKNIIRFCVRSLISQGFQLSVFDGDEYTVKRSSNADDICKAMRTTDQDALVVRRENGDRVGSIDFVYGNDGYDVIADYSCALEPELGPTNRFAEKLAERFQ